MNTKNIGLYTLAFIVIAATAAMIGVLLVREIPPTNKDVIMMSTGALLAAFGTVIGFFFGSSKSSADKNAIIGEQVKQNEK